MNDKAQAVDIINHNTHTHNKIKEHSNFVGMTLFSLRKMNEEVKLRGNSYIYFINVRTLLIW